jgi:hypothetical protein
MKGSNLRTVSEEEVPTFGPDGMVDPPPPTPRREPRGAAIAGDAIFLALKALSQRALVAIAALADLALIASAFALWLAVISNPSVLQLVGVGLYAVFVLFAMWLRGKSG